VQAMVEVDINITKALNDNSLLILILPNSKQMYIHSCRDEHAGSEPVGDEF